MHFPCSRSVLISQRLKTIVKTPYTECSSLEIPLPQLTGAVPTTEAVALVFINFTFSQITPVEPILFVCCTVVLGVLRARILCLITPTLEIAHVSE